MFKRLIIIVPLIAAVLFTVWHFNSTHAPIKGNNVRSDLKEEVQILLREAIDTNSKNNILNDQFILSSPDLIRKYYIKNDHVPVWIGSNKETADADSLIEQIKLSVYEGLSPAEYHLNEIETLQKELPPNNNVTTNTVTFTKWLQFEILLTDAFFTLTRHLYAGRIHTDTINKEWADKIALINVVDSLKKIPEQNNIRKIISGFNNSHLQYKKLKQIMRQYVNISKEGGWAMLKKEYSNNKKFNVNIIALRKRLFLSGELSEANSDTLFDSTLIKAVKLFQRTHTLKETGVIDEITLKELNVPVSERIKQIGLNMERLRWLPLRIKEDMVLVNTAGYKLDIMNDNRSVLDMKIIIGKTDHRTPLFSSEMLYIILNPWWEVPMNIAKKEMLPKIKNDNTYLAKQNIKIYNSWKADAEEISPEEINWDLVTTEKFYYRLRQTPGTWNALGRVKFIFPNNYNVYMHDTPNKELFAVKNRTFSHGCIRIEKPVELAVYLLRNNKNWSEEKLMEFLESNQTKTIVLPVPVKVFIGYYTVWFNNDTAFFSNDIYNYDATFEKQFAN